MWKKIFSFPHKNLSPGKTETKKSLVFLVSGSRMKLHTRLILHQFYMPLLLKDLSQTKLMQTKSRMKLHTRLH